MTRTYDVAIVGAGPAGATAARVLAEGGASVVLVDRARFPRPKTCGGGIVRRARALLPRGADLPIEREVAAVAMRFSGSDLSFEVRGREPIIAMAMRADFDAALVDAAIRAGAQMRPESALESLVQRADAVEIRTTTGTISARFTIGADGATGATARLAGWREPLATIPAIEAEIELEPGERRRFEDRAVFDYGAIEHGYGWLFPKRAHLSVGVLTTRRGPAGLKRELDRYLELAGVRGARMIDVKGYVIPVRPRSEGVARGRVLLAGDAAGLADPLTLEGISIAMKSGELAARAILDHGDAAAVAYARSLRRDVLRELAVARKLAWFLYEKPAAARALFRRVGQPMCEAMCAVVAGERTYRSLVASPGSWLGLAQLALARR